MHRIIAFVGIMGLAALAQEGGWNGKAPSKKTGEKPTC